MVISDYITPVMYTDREGNFAILAIIALCVVVPLFLMSTYALIEESRPILDPIIENISVSLTGGPGQGADFSKIGTFAGAGMAGFNCDVNGCRKVENSEQINLFIYTYTSQNENGEFITYEGWGIGPFMLVNDGKDISAHLLFDFSTNITPTFAISFQVDIDLGGLIDGYIEFGKK